MLRDGLKGGINLFFF